MRTTVSIADDLLVAAKDRAAARRQTLSELVEGAVRRELAMREERAERPAVPVFRGGTGPRPGVDLSSNAALHELLDDGEALDARR